MQFRHELKYEITPQDMLVLRSRLRLIMQPDRHAINGRYDIRSLYFDSPDDQALRDKVNGVSIREKYRIRLYNHDPTVIHLERKYKSGGLGYKMTAPLTAEEAQRIIDGDIAWLKAKDSDVLLAFYTRLRTKLLTPRVLVDYTREPFVFAPGNVRVTLDYNIRTALSSTALLNPYCTTIPVRNAPCILEIKWDNYLPDVIRDAVQLGCRTCGAYSKYAACRMFE